MSKVVQSKVVVLKPSKEVPILNRHHWIFSGAIAKMPSFQDGDILPVESYSGVLLGHAYFNSKTNIRGRMVSFGDTSPEIALKKNLENAIKLRGQLFNNPEKTNAYRLVNGEGDMLPGLIIDRYEDVFVMQITTIGMERWKTFVVEYLIAALQPKAIYEHSTGPSRREEGLKDKKELLYGSLDAELIVRENGYKFCVSIENGQKTGFFLDHREMRSMIQPFVFGGRVLNCFGYSGAFSVYAGKAGSNETVTVDISQSAIDLAKKNIILNELSPESNKLVKADVFEFLSQENLDYNFIILDPPAFAKKKQSVVAACRGYKEINRLAMQKMPVGSLLLTCSCSYHVDPKIFQMVVFQAAVEAKRAVKIIGKHRQAPDHPVNLCHPEGDYLKSLLLQVL